MQISLQDEAPFVAMVIGMDKADEGGMVVCVKDDFQVFDLCVCGGGRGRRIKDSGNRWK